MNAVNYFKDAAILMMWVIKDNDKSEKLMRVGKNWWNLVKDSKSW